MDRTTVSAVCEVGPVAIRRLGGVTEPVDPVEVAAALDGGDDPLVLVGDRPVEAGQVWRAVLAPVLRGIDHTVLVHPSWWPATRAGVVSAMARQLCGSVETSTRSSFIAADGGIVVEIAPHLVAVSGPQKALLVESRSGAPDLVADSVVRTVLARCDAGPVWLDNPAAVPGAQALAGMIGDGLRAAGRDVLWVSDRQMTRAATATQRQDAVPDPPSRPTRWPLTAAVVGAVLVGVVAVGLRGGHRAEGTSPMPSTALVEGRVTMDIPAGWAVQRVTAGPGSARVQVVSPTDRRTILHLTQARARDEDLAASAATLRRAFDSQPAGVFTDFHPADIRAGRPAITYREVRPGHDVRWVVILDGGVRISIGCQSAVGAEHDIAPACEQAVRSAHEIS
ncbi:MAG: type VII secretion-associated protein [Mycobacterium sp.]